VTAMKRNVLLIGGLVAWLVLSIDLYAQTEPIAELTYVAGKVLVNQGVAYADAHETRLLYRGDRVLLLENASALVTYKKNQCTVVLHANSLFTLVDAAQCGNKQVILAMPGAAGLLGGTGGGGSVSLGAVSLGEAAGTVFNAPSSGAASSPISPE